MAKGEFDMFYLCAREGGEGMSAPSASVFFFHGQITVNFRATDLK